MQRWLEAEILHTELVDEGFYVPSVRFALVMQLSHIHHHFMGEGIGLRHVCDYFMLLRNSSAEDRRVVAGRLKSFGLHHTAGALMWVLGKVLQFYLQGVVERMIGRIRRRILSLTRHLFK